MSYQAIWEPEALAQAERFAKTNPDRVGPDSVRGSVFSVGHETVWS